MLEYRIFDKELNEYKEEPDYRWMLTRQGKLYDSENDKYHVSGERYLVEFYTGLKDKNKVKIFDGDTLTTGKYPCIDDDKQNYVLDVEFIYNSWQTTYRLVNENKRGISDGINDLLNGEGHEEFSDDLEIIGTIHD